MRKGLDMWEVLDPHEYFIEAHRGQDTILLMMNIPTPLANSGTDSCRTARPSKFEEALLV